MKKRANVCVHVAIDVVRFVRYCARSPEWAMFKKFTETEVCAPQSCPCARLACVHLLGAHACVQTPTDLHQMDVRRWAGGGQEEKEWCARDSLTHCAYPPAHTGVRAHLQVKDSGKLKSSDQRKIRQSINDQYPLLVS